jgi:hypothetical protein
MMKMLVRPVAIVFLWVTACHAQGARFFPKSSFGGYLQMDFAGPHNEWDLNRCAANAGAPSNGGFNAPCSAFARAALGGRLEFKPINVGPFKRLYLYFAPRSFFGDNLPQTRYSQSFNGIGMEKTYGLIYELSRGFEAVLIHHAKMTWFGKYQKFLGPADLNNNPYGQFNSVGIRWKFGTFRYRREE